MSHMVSAASIFVRCLRIYSPFSSILYALVKHPVEDEEFAFGERPHNPLVAAVVMSEIQVLDERRYP